MSVIKDHVVLRLDGDRLSTRGPYADPVTEAEAKAEAARLAAQNPNGAFVILKVVAEVSATQRVMMRTVGDQRARVIPISQAAQ